MSIRGRLPAAVCFSLLLAAVGGSRLGIAAPTDAPDSALAAVVDPPCSDPMPIAEDGDPVTPPERAPSPLVPGSAYLTRLGQSIAPPPPLPGPPSDSRAPPPTRALLEVPHS